MKKFICATIHYVFLAFIMNVNAQTSISGVINSYTNLTTIDTINDYIIVGNASSFDMGDTLLIVQMKGANMDTTNSSNFGDILNLNGAGLYELNVVDTVYGDTIGLVFEFSNYYDPTGIVQVVNVPVYQNAILNGDVSCNNWNGSTGGIVVLSVIGNLDLNGNNIIASERGSSGGSYSFGSGNGCSFVSSFSDFYYDNGTWEGSPKGEGIADYESGKEYGRGPQANGGGGGNDHNSGGAGGAHVSSGGNGGENQDPGAFNCKGTFPGLSGNPITNPGNRVFMGGAGGSGHKNNSPTINSGDGGEGGGIIIILAGSIEGNNGAILANGQDGFDADNDGAGGGGAAGTILISAGSYGSTTIQIDAIGGNGGDARNSGTSTCLGPGGGGSGGAIFLTSSNLPANVQADTAEGIAGLTINSTSGCNNNSLNATDGGLGEVVLNATLVFSSIPLTALSNDLIYFFGSCNAGNYNFRWITAQNRFIDFYNLEHSENLLDWSTLDNVDALSDQNKLNEYNTSLESLSGYFRVNQINEDGSTELSKIINLNCSLTKPSIQIFPVPSSKQLNIQTDMISNNVRFKIYTVAGILYNEGYLNLNGDINQVDISDLPFGMYMIELVTTNHQIHKRFQKI